MFSSLNELNPHFTYLLHDSPSSPGTELSQPNDQTKEPNLPKPPTWLIADCGAVFDVIDYEGGRPGGLNVTVGAKSERGVNGTGSDRVVGNVSSY